MSNQPPIIQPPYIDLATAERERRITEEVKHGYEEKMQDKIIALNKELAEKNANDPEKLIKITGDKKFSPEVLALLISGDPSKTKIIKDYFKNNKNAKEAKEFYDEQQKQIEKLENELEEHPQSPDGIEKFLHEELRKIDHLTSESDKLINPDHIAKYDTPDRLSKDFIGALKPAIGDFCSALNKEKITENDIDSAKKALTKIAEKCKEVERTAEASGRIKGLAKEIEKLANDSMPDVDDKTFNAILTDLDPLKIEKIATLHEDKAKTFIESIIESIKSTVKSLFGIEALKNPDTKPISEKVNELIKSIQGQKYGNLKKNTESVLAKIKDLKEYINKQTSLTVDERNLRVVHLELIEKKLQPLRSSDLGKIIKKDSVAKLSAMLNVDKNGLPFLYQSTFGCDNSDTLVLQKSMHKKDGPTFGYRINDLLKLPMTLQNRIRIIELQEKEGDLKFLKEYVDAKKNNAKEAEIEAIKNKIKNKDQRAFNNLEANKPLIDTFIESCKNDMKKNEGLIAKGLQDNIINPLKSSLDIARLDIENVAAEDEDAINLKIDGLIEIKERLLYLVKSDDVKKPKSAKEELIEAEIADLEKKKAENSEIIAEKRKKALESLEKYVSDRIESFEEAIKKWDNKGGKFYQEERTSSGGFAPLIKDLTKIRNTAPRREEK